MVKNSPTCLKYTNTPTAWTMVCKETRMDTQENSLADMNAIPHSISSVYSNDKRWCLWNSFVISTLFPSQHLILACMRISDLNRYRQLKHISARQSLLSIHQTTLIHLFPINASSTHFTYSNTRKTGSSFGQMTRDSSSSSDTHTSLSHPRLLMVCIPSKMQKPYYVGAILDYYLHRSSRILLT